MPQERLLGTGRFTTDKSGYAAMRRYVKPWPRPGLGGRGSQRRRASVGATAGRGRRARGRRPAKLAARVRLFDTGHNRKTDALDAHSIAVVAVRTPGCGSSPPMVSSRRCGCSPTAATSWPT